MDIGLELVDSAALLMMTLGHFLLLCSMWIVHFTVLSNELRTN